MADSRFARIDGNLYRIDHESGMREQIHPDDPDYDAACAWSRLLSPANAPMFEVIAETVVEV